MRMGCRFCDRHHKSPMLYAFQTNDSTGKLLNLPGFTMNDKDLETGIVIEMRMAGGDYQFVTGVLKRRQLLRNTMSMMVVDEGYSADYRGIGTCRLLCDEAVTNQIAKRFGPVGIAKPGDEIVKALEKIGIECNSDSTKDTHDHSLSERNYFPGKATNSMIE